MKFEKILSMLSISLLIFNLMNFIGISLLKNILLDPMVLIGSGLFSLLLIFSFIAAKNLKNNNIKKAGWIYLVLAFFTVGTNPLLNILTIIHVIVGTSLVVTYMKQNRIGEVDN